MAKNGTRKSCYLQMTTLVAASQESLRQVVGEFGRMCDRNLRVNEKKSKVIKRNWMVDDSNMNVALCGKLFKEVKCFQYLGSHIAINEVKHEVKYGTNEVG